MSNDGTDRVGRMGLSIIDPRLEVLYDESEDFSHRKWLQAIEWEHVEQQGGLPDEGYYYVSRVVKQLRRLHWTVIVLIDGNGHLVLGVDPDANPEEASEASTE